MKFFIILLRFFFDISNFFFGPKNRKVNILNKTLNTDFSIRIYSPLDSKSSLPVFFYCHGGGWIIGSINAYDKIFKYICCMAKCIVVAVDYRKAPEHKFPAALNDTVYAYKWLIQNIEKINGSRTKIFLGGDSAGGNLILGLYNKIRQENYQIPASLILIYPVIAPKLQYPKNSSYGLFETGENILNWCLNLYFSQPQEFDFPDVSFLKDINLNLPETLIITAGRDVLTTNINRFINIQSNYQNNIKLLEYKNAYHGFFNFYNIYPQAKSALDSIIKHISTKSSLL